MQIFSSTNVLLHQKRQAELGMELKTELETWNPLEVEMELGTWNSELGTWNFAEIEIGCPYKYHKNGAHLIVSKMSYLAVSHSACSMYN